MPKSSTRPHDTQTYCIYTPLPLKQLCRLNPCLLLIFFSCSLLVKTYKSCSPFTVGEAIGFCSKSFTNFIVTVSIIQVDHVDNKPNRYIIMIY